MRRVFEFAALSAVVLGALFSGYAQDDSKRSRGEGFYADASANTVAAWDLWVTGRVVGHIWDKPPNDTSGGTTGKHLIPTNVRAFPELAAELGLFDLASLAVESRVLSYGYKPGCVSAAAKFTYPDNKKLRLNGYGIELKYQYNFFNSPPTFGSPGWMPEGYVMLGHVAQAKFLYDLDLISLRSYLPFKVSANLGIRVPYTQSLRPFSQYLVDAAIAYVGYDFDVFVEYSLEAFLNNSTAPKLLPWSSVNRIEVAWSENPMYLTPGARIRYPNGLTLYACVPLLLSVNQGSGLKDYGTELRNDYPDEVARGVTQGFDPWFVKWKIVAQISMPLHYTQSSAEMMRNFLLLKNRPQRTKINLDEKIQGLIPNAAPSADSTANQKTDQQRLDEIKKKREEMNR